MLIPIVPAKEFKRFGFKKCAGDYGKHDVIIFVFPGESKCFS